MEPITVRPATAQDAPLLARISLIAARAHMGWGFYDAFFPAPDDDLLRRLQRFATTRAVSFHHFSTRLVAELEGEPSGAIAGYVESTEMSDRLAAAMREIFDARELADIAQRSVAVNTCHVPHPDGAWVVELVGTLPKYRGRGVGRRLLTEVLARGRERGHRLASVYFEIGNDPAERAYAGAGFRFAEERRSPDFERVMRTPGMRRMEMPL